MNYIKHLAGFFERVAVDERLNPTHVSMYVSLFQFWNASRFQNPISISRNELMKVSKISAKATYHKCMERVKRFRISAIQTILQSIQRQPCLLVQFSGKY